MSDPFSAVASAVGGLFGLFGKKKKKDPTPRENLLSQAQGAREASEKYGFNPLTMMQYGQTGGAMAGSGGAAPLASLQMLTDGLKGLDDIASGDRARRRAADELEIDLARLRLDQMRSGVIIQDRTAREGVGNGPSPLGRNTVTHLPSGAVARSVAAPLSTIRTGVLPDGDNPNEGHPLADNLGQYSIPDPTLDRGAGITLEGRYVTPTPGWSPAEHIETEYGDAASWLYGFAKAGRDLSYNVGLARQIERDKRRPKPKPKLNDRDRARSRARQHYGSQGHNVRLY